MFAASLFRFLRHDSPQGLFTAADVDLRRVYVVCRLTLAATPTVSMVNARTRLLVFSQQQQQQQQ